MSLFELPTYWDRTHSITNREIVKDSGERNLFCYSPGVFSSCIIVSKLKKFKGTYMYINTYYSIYNNNLSAQKFKYISPHIIIKALWISSQTKNIHTIVGFVALILKQWHVHYLLIAREKALLLQSLHQTFIA